MTSYKYVIYLIVLFILFSCNKTENERVGTVNVEDLYRKNDPGYSTVDLQTKFDKNSYDIEKEIGSFNGDSNYIFGEIKRIVTYKNNIFVLDTRDKQIKSYTLDGVWNGNFDLYGSGPGELLAPADLAIDELNEDLIVLGSQGNILKLDIDKKNLSLKDEIQVNNFCQTICLSENNFVVRHRLKIDESDSTKSHKNIVMYDQMNGTPKRAVGDVHSIHNWLITREFSKGEIFCSDDNIYSFDWYVPRLLIYNGPNYNDIHKIWFKNLNLIRIESSLNEQGLPRLTFDRSDGNAMLKNVNISETDVFIQLLEYKRNGGETIYTYQLDKKTFQVKDAFNDMGIIHQITDKFIFTSINHPFPKIVVYRR